MKKQLLVFILLNSYFLNCTGQNYQCLQSGVKHYFINGNGYLRGIRIDSVTTLSEGTVYYPFHTPRGNYTGLTPSTDVYSLLDNSGGSWLGKKVLQRDDGTFVFDSYWNDSVIIKTQAHTGDSWVLYRDASDLHYNATVISTDTATVLSTRDSIKTILITAENSSGIVATDPLDSFTIILSKNSGFVRVPDLYTFPYHKPDSAYRQQLDFFLDRSSCNNWDINTSNGYAPNERISLFELTEFINPNEQQLHDWQVGDIIESDNELGIPASSVTVTFLQDTVADEVVAGHLKTYSIRGSRKDCSTGYFPAPCSLICEAGTYSFSDSVFPLMDTSKMPEESSYSGNYLFYYPGDTNHCARGAAYITTPQHYLTGFGWVLTTAAYKLGIGKTNYHYADGDPTYETDRLLYHNIHGQSCGVPAPSSVGSIYLTHADLSIFPDPATSVVTLSATRVITNVTITNLMGQAIYNHDHNSDKVQIDISGLPSGIYLVKINGSEVRKFVKD